jgi:hypothetical protein
MSAATAGRNPRAVSAVEALIRMPSRPVKIRFHFSTNTLVKHQKLATLSSNRPRPNGKMRVIGAAIVEKCEKGGRNGTKRRMKANVVVSPRRRNKRVLDNVQLKEVALQLLQTYPWTGPR